MCADKTTVLEVSIKLFRANEWFCWFFSAILFTDTLHIGSALISAAKPGQSFTLGPISYIAAHSWAAWVAIGRALYDVAFSPLTMTANHVSMSPIFITSIRTRRWHGRKKITFNTHTHTTQSSKRELIEMCELKSSFVAHSHNIKEHGLAQWFVTHNFHYSSALILWNFQLRNQTIVKIQIVFTEVYIFARCRSTTTATTAHGCAYAAVGLFGVIDTTLRLIVAHSHAKRTK